MRFLYRMLSFMNWFSALARGPGALTRRYGRTRGYRSINRIFRR